MKTLEQIRKFFQERWYHERGHVAVDAFETTHTIDKLQEDYDRRGKTIETLGKQVAELTNRAEGAERELDIFAPIKWKYIRDNDNSSAQTKTPMKNTNPSTRPFQYLGDTSEFPGATEQQILNSMAAGFANPGNLCTLRVLLHHSGSSHAFPADPYPKLFPAQLAALDELVRDGLLARTEVLVFDSSSPSSSRVRIKYHITHKGTEHIKRLVSIPYPRPDRVSPAFGWEQDVYFMAPYVARVGPAHADSPKCAMPPPEEEKEVCYIQRKGDKYMLRSCRIDPSVPWVKVNITRAERNKILHAIVSESTQKYLQEQYEGCLKTRA